jgi:DNA-binding transcriptional LysR family regulator
MKQADVFNATLTTTEMIGPVRFGMIQDLADEVLTEIVTKFSRGHPRVRLELTVGNSVELASALAAGTLEGALLAGKPDDGTPLFRRERLVWIASQATAISEDGPVPLVLCTVPCGLRKTAIDLLEKAGIPWRLAFSSPSIAGVKAAVRAGLGITLRGTSFLDLGLVAFKGRPKLPNPPKLDIVLATSPQAAPATRAFAELVRATNARARS